MENKTKTTKNVTLSFKTTTEDKTALQQIANQKQISRSELIASLVHAYKHSYDYIGKTSPIEEELTTNINVLEAKNRKLVLSLENAENRIELEQKSNRKLVNENLKLNKSIFDLKEKLKTSNFEISRLNELINEPSKYNSKDSEILYTSFGSLILSGISLILLPYLFKN